MDNKAINKIRRRRKSNLVQHMCFRKKDFIAFFPQFDLDKEFLVEIQLLDDKYNEPFNWKGTETTLLEYFYWVDKGHVQAEGKKICYPGSMWKLIAEVFRVKGKPLKTENMSKLFYAQGGNYQESTGFIKIKQKINEYHESEPFKKMEAEHFKAIEKKREREIALQEAYNAFPGLVEKIKTISKVWPTNMELQELSLMLLDAVNSINKYLDSDGLVLGFSAGSKDIIGSNGKPLFIEKSPLADFPPKIR
ncbi:MAG: hypothetical protein LBH07_08970 [Treponema sp.]|jgi:hypothetical protein|nr:hypothetical protein [Treponema sp.]